MNIVWLLKAVYDNPLFELCNSTCSLKCKNASTVMEQSKTEQILAEMLMLFDLYLNCDSHPS